MEKQKEIEESADVKFHLYCFYVAVGQKRSIVAQIAEVPNKVDSMRCTAIVADTASDATLLQYLTPYIRCATFEYFRRADL